MRFQTLPERNCVTRLKLDPRRMARPASVISPQWSNPIVTRGLANLLLSCEMRSRSVDARVATTFPSGGRNTRKSTAYGCPRCTPIPSLSNLRAHFVDTLFSCYVQNESATRTRSSIIYFDQHNGLSRVKRVIFLQLIVAYT